MRKTYRTTGVRLKRARDYNLPVSRDTQLNFHVIGILPVQQDVPIDVPLNVPIDVLIPDVATSIPYVDDIECDAPPLENGSSVSVV